MEKIIFGIGIDVIEIARVQSVGVDRLTKRILTAKEQEWVPKLNQRKIEYIAGRFAAKEAISKAVGTGIGQVLSFLDIEIHSNEKGALQVALSHQVMKRIFEEKQIQIYLSISHSEHYVSAIAIIERE